MVYSIGTMPKTTSSAGSAVSTRTPDKSSAQVIDPRLLASDPNGQRGKNVILQGKSLTATQQPDYTWMQLMAQIPERSTTESVIIEVRPKNAALLKDECYRVYAVAAGTQDVT